MRVELALARSQGLLPWSLAACLLVVSRVGWEKGFLLNILLTFWYVVYMFKKWQTLTGIPIPLFVLSPSRSSKFQQISRCFIFSTTIIMWLFYYLSVYSVFIALNFNIPSFFLIISIQTASLHRSLFLCLDYGEDLQKMGKGGHKGHWPHSLDANLIWLSLFLKISTNAPYPCYSSCSSLFFVSSMRIIYLSFALTCKI